MKIHDDFFLAVALTACGTAADRPPITGLSHVGFQVGDMEKSRTYYRALLGYEEPFRLNKGDTGTETVYFKINDRQFIELQTGLAPDGVDTFVHIAYEVSDAEAMRQYLAEKAVPVPARVETDALGHRSFQAVDFLGNRVEFVEYTPASLILKTRGKAVSPRRLSGRCFHTCIPVVDEDAAVRFYCRILGFSEMNRSHADRRPNWINYRLPEAAVYLECTLLDKNTDPRRNSLRTHLGLAVPDVQEAFEVLRERVAAAGWKWEGYPNIGFNNRWQVGAFDPDGRRHELMESYTAR